MEMRLKLQIMLMIEDQREVTIESYLYAFTFVIGLKKVLHVYMDLCLCAIGFVCVPGKGLCWFLQYLHSNDHRKMLTEMAKNETPHRHKTTRQTG